ncbi:hypothetical protein Goshw_024536 [Gossypium schwendimanii]|uniref:Uncharacterized protein n=3 Tax=Gossypium TaxID=3633 RepID=A0A7J8NSU9_GOSRA|nr:hypothetical protein [Gossypium raimondii]MBA0758987.1 hypothetical protein [Gossypium trilobum]MBA0850049.1 hypothetical protein [Gossypium schwendimanii]
MLCTFVLLYLATYILICLLSISGLQTCTQQIVCFSNYPLMSEFHEVCWCCSAGLAVFSALLLCKRLTLEGTGGAQHREVLNWNQGAAER